MVYGRNILVLTNMHTKRKAWLIVLVLIVLIKIFSLFPYAVEKYYSNGIYPVISRLLRFLFGWLPFSIGDLLYALAGIYLLIKAVQFIRAIFKKQAGKTFWWNAIRWILFTACWYMRSLIFYGD